MAEADQHLPPTLLDGIRVIDIATPRAEMAGRVLADLGAEVIKVEPPDGAPARQLPPFSDADPDRSLYWAHVGFGKRSVVIDPDSPTQRGDFLALLRTADVLIESAAPGFMAAHDFSYEHIKDEFPRLIYASVTPYGQDGPHADRPAANLTVEAAGGLISLQGDGDRPPISVGYPQAAFHAGVQAAADVCIALRERERSGLGQHLDVSQQAAMVWTLMNATGYPPNTGGDPPGTCADRAGPPNELTAAVHPCKDGYVVFNVVPGGLGLRHATAFLKRIAKEGALTGEMEGVDVDEWAAHIAELVQTDPAATAPMVLEASKQIHEFAAARTMNQLFRWAVEDGYMMAPLYTSEDIADDPHLQVRDYWVEVDGRRYPGPFAKASLTPLKLERAAPALGQDQHLLDEAKSGGRAPAVIVKNGNGASPPKEGAFDGIKVADFAWVGVGPLISKSLADHGATVVHIESATRPDVLRLAPPFKDNVPGIDNGQFMANFNSSKIGVALRLDTEAGHRYARELIDWADIVVESFTPGTMKRFGFDYETISADRPELIMLSTCLRGQYGPDSSYAGFGLQGACLAGLHRITGWPDRTPAGTWGAYTDFINPRFGSAILASAIRYRDLTGRGQRIDLAQTEAGIHFQGPLQLDYFENGRVSLGAGHDSLYACPHGTFQTAGDERYVAIAVETAEQWRALRDVAGLTRWTADRCDDLAQRIRHKPGIEADLANWCRPQSHDDVIAALEAAGVPVALVQRPSDLYLDPQLEHRGFFVTLDHGVMGPTPYDGLVTRFSRAKAGPRKAAPVLGEDTHLVLSDILRKPDEEIAESVAAGVFQ